MIEESTGGTAQTVQPRKEPVQARSRQRFARILQEATQLIDRQGVDAVSMKEIAQNAGISIASLYQYFPDKASIVATLAHQIYDEGQHCIRAIFAEVSQRDQVEAALCEMLDSYMDCFNSVPGAYAIWQATQSDHRLQQLDADDCAAHEATLRQTLNRVAPRLQDRADLLAKVWVGLVASLVRRAVVLDPAEVDRFLALCKAEVIRPSVRHTLAGTDPG